MKTILAFSGGLDSVYLLWKELTSTDNEVTAVYFANEDIPTQTGEYHTTDIESQEDSKARWYHIQNIAEVMKGETRDFALIKIAYDKSLLSETDWAINHGARLRVQQLVPKINDGTYDRYTAGFERENDGWAFISKVYLGNDTGSSQAWKVFKDNATRGELDFPLMRNKYTQAVAYKELPQALLDVFRSCNETIRTTRFTSCNKCYKCFMKKYTKRLLAEGKTPDEIYDLHTEKSVLPNGNWKSQKLWLSEELPEYNEYNRLKDSYSEIPMPRWENYYKVSE